MLRKIVKFLGWYNGVALLSIFFHSLCYQTSRSITFHCCFYSCFKIKKRNHFFLSTKRYDCIRKLKKIYKIFLTLLKNWIMYTSRSIYSWRKTVVNTQMKSQILWKVLMERRFFHWGFFQIILFFLCFNLVLTKLLWNENIL